MTGIFFGSTMGTTEAVAADIAKQLGVADADVHNVADTPAGEVQVGDTVTHGPLGINATVTDRTVTLGTGAVVSDTIQHTSTGGELPWLT